jgi:hypothetical protein
MVLSSVLASGIGAKSIVSSAKTSTSTTGDKLPNVAISSAGGVFILSWEMAWCQRCLDLGNFVLFLTSSLQRKKISHKFL